MSNLAFAGKLFHGGVDVGSLLPAVQMPTDPQCRFDQHAQSAAEALSDDAPTHGNVHDSVCGDDARRALILVLEQFNHAIMPGAHSVGVPAPPLVPDGTGLFAQWPRWDDVTHQKMYVDWIRRAFDGGLRVMVALSHNSRTLARRVSANGAGPISGVVDDKASSKLQIDEIIKFAARHQDWMEVARSSADVHRIVSANKLAIVLGVEVDNIGDLNDKPFVTEDDVRAEITALYDQGVRYVFPIHITDNVFGDTAIYESFFDFQNYLENGTFWQAGCSTPDQNIAFTLNPGSPEFGAALGVNIPIPAALCPPGQGNVNKRTPGGLTPLGKFAIQVMMQHGMLIDVDHMSNDAVDTALSLAWNVRNGGYPMMSGHNGVRHPDVQGSNSENQRTSAQLKRIACLGGMFGLGTNAAEAFNWAKQYIEAEGLMYSAFAPGNDCPNKFVGAGTLLGPGVVALGTDTNSIVRTPRPTMVEWDKDPKNPPGLPRATDIYDTDARTVNKDNPLGMLRRFVVQVPDYRGHALTAQWDYKVTGVANYGMYSDFLHDVRTYKNAAGLPTGTQIIDDLMGTADHFYRTWQRAEAQASAVTVGAPTSAVTTPPSFNKCVQQCATAEGTCMSHARDSASRAACVGDDRECARACGASLHQ